MGSTVRLLPQVISVTKKRRNDSAVQVGNPFMEKLLMEACLKLTHDHKDWLVGIQDMGAGRDRFIFVWDGLKGK